MKSSIIGRYNVYVPKAERNSAAHLKFATRTVYPLGSKFKLMCLLDHASTKQRCEIQCEALEFSEKLV